MYYKVPKFHFNPLTSFRDKNSLCEKTIFDITLQNFQISCITRCPIWCEWLLATMERMLIFEEAVASVFHVYCIASTMASISQNWNKLLLLMASSSIFRVHTFQTHIIMMQTCNVTSMNETSKVWGHSFRKTKFLYWPADIQIVYHCSSL